jgi:hypothetical protein
MKRVFRRPSPATVLAVAALLVALGGTAVAGGVLNKKKVNNIVTNRAPGLSVGNSAKLGGQPPPAFQSQLLSAVVRTDGTLAGGVGAVISNRGSAGRYTVKFNRDIMSCALVSSATTPTPNPGPGDLGAGTLLGYAAVTHLQGAADSVYVRAGNDSTPDADTSFTVLVAC